MRLVRRTIAVLLIGAVVGAQAAGACWRVGPSRSDGSESQVSIGLSPGAMPAVSFLRERPRLPAQQLTWFEMVGIPPAEQAVLAGLSSTRGTCSSAQAGCGSLLALHVLLTI